MKAKTKDHLVAAHVHLEQADEVGVSAQARSARALTAIAHLMMAVTLEDVDDE